jgi:ketosteroid isomerase-like protein
MKRSTPLLLLIVLFAACNESATTEMSDEPKRDTVDYKAVIDETNKTFANAMVKGDSATLVSLYHPDASVYAPNMEKTDPKTMASMASGMPKMGITSFNLEAKEVYRGDDVVTEVGTFEMGDGKKTIDKGKYIVIWKKDGDKWKLFRDIWNSDNPPPPAPPQKK